MTAGHLPRAAAVDGGHGVTPQPPPFPTSIAGQGPAATTLGGVAAGPRDCWPPWARLQLDEARALADASTDRGATATLLYRDWFCPPVQGTAHWRTARPLAGVYRFAHAGTARRISVDGVVTVARNDVLGKDGWWRTWGRHWTPPRNRPGSVRVLLTPSPALVADVVAAVTAALLDADVPWSLTCATEPRRLRHTGAAVLDLPAVGSLPAGLLATLAPMLLPASAPLCLPIAPGVAAAGYPDNGMTFGEHRCHLIALALRAPAAGDPLAAIADVFRSYGVDPAHPDR